jgi:hypothetical protein
VLNLACREEAKVAKASRDLAANITKSLNPRSENASTIINIEESRIYIDATISMTGFANQNSTFDELLDDLGNVMPGAQVYKYGQKGNTPPEDISALVKRAGFGLEIHRPSFYDLTYNPDDRLIDFLATEDLPVRSVLITDGVYSEQAGSTAPPVVEAIRKWMGRGRIFGILIFRSAFNGKFYSERVRGMQPAMPVSDRPFYAFVFSPTEQGFREVQEKLQRHFRDVQVILFTDNAAETTVTLPKDTKASYAKKTPPDTDYYWQMFNSDLFAQANPVPLKFTAKAKPPTDYPATELTFSVQAEYYRWDQQQFKKVEGGPPRGFSHTFEANQPATNAESNKAVKKAGKDGGQTMGEQPNLTVFFPKDASSGYGFYALKLVPAIKELRPEIQQLSTRDDSNRADANKTFRFFELITALTDIHFKDHLARRISPAIFVTLDNH